MLEEKQNVPLDKKENLFASAALARRTLFKFAGLGALGTMFGTAGCRIHKEIAGRLNVGDGDFAVLNYAYALEQMEAAFYTKVTSNFYQGATEMEKDLLTDIRNDEIAHREWFERVLLLKKLPDLKFDFSSVNFNDRTSVLTTGKNMEDVGTSGYNGAGQLLKVDKFLKHAGKIVSVEARHVATLRNLLNYGDFAGDDISDENGLDMARTPQEVIAINDKYFVTKITVENIGKS